MTDNIIKETNTPAADSFVLKYLVREPKVKAEKKKALILLHGVGSNESDLFSLANQFPDDYLVISARGQFTLGAGRYAWFNVDFSTGKPIFDKAQEASSRELIRKFIVQVKKEYQLDEVYLGGFSQGAIMSLSIGLTHPTEVQRVIALSGRLLVEIRPFITKNDDLQKLKIFLAHGTQDNTLQIAFARDAKAFLDSLPVQLSYYEYEMGHQINGSVIKDVNAWLDK